MTPEQSLIIYLFAKGEPIAHRVLREYFKLDEETYRAHLQAAGARLAPVGLTLLDDGAYVEIRNSVEAQSLVEQIRKDALRGDIGKAALETLAILTYKGVASRAEIDHIRGVNSSHILRALSMRGLVRRVQKPGDERSYLYEPTTELLAHLGVASVEALPNYEAIRANIAALEVQKKEVDEAEEDTTL